MRRERPERKKGAGRPTPFVHAAAPVYAAWRFGSFQPGRTQWQV